MMPQEKGLSKEDIERILNFDWDASTDEGSTDEAEDIAAVLGNNLGMEEREESTETGLIDNIMLI